jgi:hypothetical protein
VKVEDEAPREDEDGRERDDNVTEAPLNVNSLESFHDGTRRLDPKGTQVALWAEYLGGK